MSTKNGVKQTLKLSMTSEAWRLLAYQLECDSMSYKTQGNQEYADFLGNIAFAINKLRLKEEGQ